MRRFFQEGSSFFGVGRRRSRFVSGRIHDVDLSQRQLECLELVADGKSEWEISRILGISEHTVEKHLLTAKTKLNAVNRVQAVAEALRRRLIV